MYSRNYIEEPKVYRDSDLTLFTSQAYSIFGSNLRDIEGIAETGALITLTLILRDKHGSVVSIEYREPIHVAAEIHHMATVSFTSLQEFPELVPLVRKLIEEKPLDDIDMLNMVELAKAVGWNIEDASDELKNIWRDPLDRVSKYKNMVEKYYSNAINLVGKDPQQAAEKLWGAITSLIKLHASLRRVFIAAWDHGKLYNYVTNNVERIYRDLFYDLLTTGEVLHRYFYEEDLDRETFDNFWNKALELLNKAKQIVYKLS